MNQGLILAAAWLELTLLISTLLWFILHHN